MKIVAVQKPDRFLVLVNEDEQDIGSQLGRIVDLSAGKAYKAFNIHSIIARGGWTEALEPLPSVEELFSRVEDVGGEGGDVQPG